MTGANFLDQNIGFMCFDPAVYPITVFRTTDGGKTWAMIPLDMPSKYSSVYSSVPGSYPQSPYFVNGKGYLTNYLDTHGTIIYFISNDGGKTWEYDPTMDIKIIE